MFFQSSEIVAANGELIAGNTELQANIEIVAAALSVLTAVRDLQVADDGAQFTRRLADRLLTAAHASGILALGGCYEATSAHICEIIEIAFLLELFRLMPSEFQRWKGYSQKLRLRHFAPHRSSGKINKLDPEKRAQRTSAYNYTRQHGLHAQVSHRPKGPPVDPHCDEGRLMEISSELSRHLPVAVLNLAAALVGKTPVSGPEISEYNRCARKLLALLESRALAN